MGHNSEVQEVIATVCNDIKELLLRKNEAYGNSALEPSRIFSTASAIEQINVRIDDKLSRIKTLTENRDVDHNDESLEDTKNDLIGYLILERVAKVVEARAKATNGQNIVASEIKYGVGRPQPGLARREV